MRIELYKNKDWLYEQYIILNKNLYDIAKEMNCDPTTICNWIKKFNIIKDFSIIKEQRVNNRQKTCLEKYGNKYYNNKEKSKQTWKNKTKEYNVCIKKL